MRTFVAVDGESFTVKGEHRYVLLANSRGDYVYDEKGLSTVKCFEFLLNLPAKTTPVAFGWNYDVNMMIKDLSASNLIELWTVGRTRWSGYSIEWIPNKWLAIRSGHRRAKISESFGFFQTSFVNALRKWEIQPQGEIESMKKQRSIFDREMKDEIIRYCIAECRDLVTLMDELEIALHNVNLSIRSWIGAGSIASAIMSREGVKHFITPDIDYPSEIFLAIREAYFGGRSELFAQGEFDSLYDYDINSAYPYEATSLPTLAQGSWRTVRRYDPGAEFALWHCSWSVDPGNIVMPFPFRQKGNIYYPSQGQGWYHSNEVNVAHSLYGDNIRIDRGFIFDPAMDDKPFDFLPELFAHRRSLKSDQHGGEKVLKLGMNAIYGKLAQGYGYRGKLPPFQSYFWAGRITAGTRSRLLSIASEKPNDLVMVATDGIFFRTPLSVPLSTDLGGLEESAMRNCFVAQPGIYSADVGGEHIGRCRGFFSKEIDFQKLRLGYQSEGPYHVGNYVSERFVGLGSCMVSHSLEKWRTWSKGIRNLSLYPSRKFLGDSESGFIRHLPPSMEPGESSEPYRPKAGNVKLDPDLLAQMVEYLEGTEQPMRDY